MRAAGIAIAASTMAIAFHGAPAQAASGTFDFKTDPEKNFTTDTFNSNIGGFTVTVSNPIVSGSAPAAGGLNASTNGLCAWSFTGTTGGRCGYNTGSGATIGSGLRGFQLSFNKDVVLNSFTISQFAPPTGATPVSFANILFNSSSSKQVAGFLITGPNTTYNFSTPFSIDAGSDLLVTTNATTLSANGGVFRIQTLAVSEVPGPLPLLGAGAAFCWSRKLRKKIKQSVA